MRRYGLGADEAAVLAEAARRAELEERHRATLHCRPRAPAAARRAARHRASLWRLVFVDGTLHEFEDNIVRRIADLLGLPPHERTALRKAAEAESVEAAAREGAEAS